MMNCILPCVLMSIWQLKSLLAIKKKKKKLVTLKNLLFSCKRANQSLRRLLAPMTATTLHSVPSQSVLAWDFCQSKRGCSPTPGPFCNSASTWLCHPIRNFSFTRISKHALCDYDPVQQWTFGLASFANLWLPFWRLGNFSCQCW